MAPSASLNSLLWQKNKPNNKAPVFFFTGQLTFLMNYSSSIQKIYVLQFFISSIQKHHWVTENVSPLILYFILFFAYKSSELKAFFSLFEIQVVV